MLDNNITLSQDEQQIILGGLLGDATLNKLNKCNTYNLRFSQSTKQEEYLMWKYSKFKKGITSIPYYYNIPNTDYKNISFYIRKNKYIKNLLTKIYNNLYIKDTKTITMDYLLQLNPMGLAVWWMDDGCLSIHKGNRYGKLCTHCFSYEENSIIKKYLKEVWNIEVDIKIEHKKYYFIRINVENLKKLITIIYPYVTQVKSMIYKIDLNYSNITYIKDFQQVYDYIKSCL